MLGLGLGLSRSSFVAESLLLDTYSGAAAAYSLRKLSSDYTGSAIRVRESATNTEADIGFNPDGTLDTTSLLAHTGANNGFVVTWYDQSGNANNATQATAAQQPQIVSSGSVIVENSLPAINFDGTDDNLDNGTTAYSQPNTVFSVAKFDNIADGKSNAIWGGNITNIVYLAKNSTNQYELNAGTPFNTGDTPSASLALQVGLLNGASSNAWENSVDLGSGNAGSNDLIGMEIGQVRDVAGTSFDGKISEIILYNSDQSANRTQIESNINSHYNIYS